ncbi:MAG TPA: cytochrome C oxidase subunit IV family protein [Candidatus Binatia bacterium]|nr:cytochrome C oxidase subunit IV family protein [Candidatus Binatia bacterium]
MDRHSSHVVPVSVYVAIFLCLMALTAITVAVAFVDLGPLSNVVAMAIAITKATLVILYFMHVRYSSRLTWLVIGSGFFWLAVMIVFTAADPFTRGLLGYPGR